MNSIPNKYREFSMKETVNLDPYCVNALSKDLDYLLSFDSDRLLAGFRETAGLDMKGKGRYEGWESTLIGGHTMGHYLSAIAQAYVNPGVSAEDAKKAKDMMATLVDGLLECQANSKGKKGFIFGATIVDKENVEKQFDNIEKNLTNIITQAWVPWYTMHKLLAGILDVYKDTGYEPALTLAKGIGDWTYDRASAWDESTAAQVIRIEYGGMNDVLYELYSLTDEEKYAVAAHYFDSKELFERVNAGGVDALNNHHANTTIPKFIGALNRYKACHGKVIGGQKVDASKYLEYAMSFWDMVNEKHTYITGGNSEWEHFGKDFVLDKERTNCNCETCNVYNMLKYSKTLFCITGDKKYSDFYENAFINTILSSQNPKTGMTTYFQPMSTGYFKVFGQRFDKFWCCTGTGMENFTKLNDSIYFHTDDAVVINMYETSKLNWKEKKLTVSMSANLQMTDEVMITVEAEDGGAIEAGVMLRIPDWCSAAPKVSIDGMPYDYKAESGYALIPADGLRSGSQITVKLPMTMKAFALPDNDRSIAFKYGPTVLSADLGKENMETGITGMMVTIPAEKISGYDDIVLPDDITPEDIINSPEKYFVEEISADGKRTFRLTINNLVFAPHFSRFEERYGIYFTVRTKAEIEEIKAAKERSLAEKPEGKVIDTVQPGYGQYENDELHRMYDWGGSVGSTECGTTRYAKSGGSFTYHMCVAPGEKNYLSLTFLKEDNGKSIKIASGDEVFFEDVLEYDGTEDSYEIRVKVPESVVNAAKDVNANGKDYKVVPLTFKGKEGAMSARLFGFVYMMVVK